MKLRNDSSWLIRDYEALEKQRDKHNLQLQNNQTAVLVKFGPDTDDHSNVYWMAVNKVTALQALSAHPKSSNDRLTRVTQSKKRNKD